MRNDALVYELQCHEWSVMNRISSPSEKGITFVIDEWNFRVLSCCFSAALNTPKESNSKRACSIERDGLLSEVALWMT